MSDYFCRGETRGEGRNDCVHRGNGCIHHGIDCVRLQEIHFRRGDDCLHGGNNCFLCVNDRIRSGHDRVRTINSQDAFGKDDRGRSINNRGVMEKIGAFIKFHACQKARGAPFLTG